MDKEKAIDDEWHEELSGYGGWLSLNSCVSLNSSGKNSKVSLDMPPPFKKRVVSKTTKNLDLNLPGHVTLTDSSDVESHDADYTYTTSFSHELEVMIFGRFPLSDYWKVCSLNKAYLSHFKRGELFKIRSELRVKELCVFMLATGEQNWYVFDREFKSRKKLPVLPADSCFTQSDKETVCAGTHLLVSGMEINGPAIWRYELATNRWAWGPSMINPRCLFASASSGESAFVAGGLSLGSIKGVLNVAEKYNSESRSWELLPRMKEKRKLCAGVYLDNKFYVIGGVNENGQHLTCGEAFHEDKSMWVRIPEMLEGAMVSGSPPLIATVDNELYAIDTSSNQLKVYLKEKVSWKVLGPIPVSTDFNKGWGVAFKSLGDELLVMGKSISYSSDGWVFIYTCRPDPNSRELEWKLVDAGRNRPSHFILNCSIMAA